MVFERSCEISYDLAPGCPRCQAQRAQVPLPIALAMPRSSPLRQGGAGTFARDSSTASRCPALCADASPRSTTSAATATPRTTENLRFMASLPLHPKPTNHWSALLPAPGKYHDHPVPDRDTNGAGTPAGSAKPSRRSRRDKPARLLPVGRPPVEPSPRTTVAMRPVSRAEDRVARAPIRIRFEDAFGCGRGTGYGNLWANGPENPGQAKDDRPNLNRKGRA
jgi:hypothetical protein